MPSIEERVRKLVDDNLEIEGRSAGSPLALNSSLRDSGLSSVEFVEFAKLVVSQSRDVRHGGSRREVVAL